MCRSGQWHAPSRHDWPAAHTFPQRPQFALSTVVYVQSPPHVVNPGIDGHPGSHAPPAQYCPAGHVRPHAPQLRVSYADNTHRPLQSISPAPHPATHALA